MKTVIRRRKSVSFLFMHFFLNIQLVKQQTKCLEKGVRSEKMGVGGGAALTLFLFFFFMLLKKKIIFAKTFDNVFLKFLYLTLKKIKKRIQKNFSFIKTKAITKYSLNTNLQNPFFITVVLFKNKSVKLPFSSLQSLLLRCFSKFQFFLLFIFLGRKFSITAWSSLLFQ